MPLLTFNCCLVLEKTSAFSGAPREVHAGVLHSGRKVADKLSFRFTGSGLIVFRV